MTGPRGGRPSGGPGRAAGTAVKGLLVLVAILSAAYLALPGHRLPPPDTAVPTIAGNDSALGRAFRDHAANIQVQGRGVVTKVLDDDNDGSRHQRFILRLGSGQTVLVSHNIDLAPRVAPLDEGDTVEFNGEYEWNNKGGLVHWTHRDPAGRHPAGWLKRGERVFQ